eukprot:CAMPEP_0197702340 /NCGR_PEP_ID=MMETSP1338-20131121/124376_1 /TAXON_ID=43686 ORGANISM="Pelagodinium beii, Strain RCC1491" /NCGR_SAMPLE_ID=MMETSP1338 /ASSEMBLY_ACC=CAM_ASM_000754 /LENGTH=121 /DNA_ID=CAMNT_0043286163 /DNA_START=243 /DNA_END=609 /DNA_ORIENTATION=-
MAARALQPGAWYPSERKGRRSPEQQHFLSRSGTRPSLLHSEAEQTALHLHPAVATVIDPGPLAITIREAASKAATAVKNAGWCVLTAHDERITLVKCILQVFERCRFCEAQEQVPTFRGCL